MRHIRRLKNYAGHWYSYYAPDPGRFAGFVYYIFFRKPTPHGCRAYIGKKLYTDRKGKNPSKWEMYKSSNKTVQSCFPEYDPLCVILGQYPKRGGVAWGESWSIAAVKALESPLYFNARMDAIFFNLTSHISVTHQELLYELDSGLQRADTLEDVEWAKL